MTLLNSVLVKRIALGVGAACLIVASGVYLYNFTSLFIRQGDFAIADSSKRVDIEIKKPVIMYGMEIDHVEVIEDVVKKNQRFTDLFSTYFVSPAIQQQLVLLSRKKFDFRKIAAGRKYTLFVEADSTKSVTALVYEASPIDYFIFHFKDSLSVETCQREVKTVEKTVAGEIKSSLSETIEQLGISHELNNKFVDIFGWQVDFQRLQKGDKFKLIYDEIQVEDKPVGTGKIGGIYFEHFGSVYYAFPFDQGDGVDYFDENGNSLRKALLKYPIEFTHISSRYNLNRFHPVLKVFRAHLGTDFSAAMGTPIRTVGDGIVEEAQFKGGNGNYVKVRHNATYTTAYLHMSKIAEGMAPGTRVRQGQTIGYVGMTGWATGPHVCYRFWKDGVQVDALKVELPPSLPVKTEYFAQFQKVKADLTKQLNLISFPELASSKAVASN
jgi:murein DD-endopeptidase MepM/ murein hydrolase activator NlpD